MSQQQCIFVLEARWRHSVVPEIACSSCQHVVPSNDDLCARGPSKIAEFVTTLPASLHTPTKPISTSFTSNESKNYLLL